MYMSDETLTALLIRRYAAAQHPLGRLFLYLHVYQQRLRAQWYVCGEAFLKRFVDILGSAAMLLLLTPVLLTLAAFIWIEDGGPVFFTQTRVGKFGRQLKMF